MHCLKSVLPIGRGGKISEIERSRMCEPHFAHNVTL